MKENVIDIELSIQENRFSTSKESENKISLTISQRLHVVCLD